MSRITRGGLLFVLCLVVAAGLVLTGCGEDEPALLKPDLEFTTYVKGATVDFDDATLNSMAAGSEASFMYGIMKSIYPTIYASNKDTVAQTLFPAPYWRGDGVHTYYSYLMAADQTTVDETIFAIKLSAAEQAVVRNAVEGFFGLYADETTAAKALDQNTAYGILAAKVSADAANTWKADAALWMAALNSYADTNYSGKTFAQLTYLERKTVEGIVFAKGAGTINPEYAFWRAMTKTSFRNSIASSMNAATRDAIAASTYFLPYAELDCVQRPTVDAMVWASLDPAGQAAVEASVDFMLNSKATLDGVLSAVSADAVTGFDTEVTSGIDMELAFYKWLAYGSFRAGTAATFYPTQVAEQVATLYPGRTYATLNSCEQLAVNAAVWAGLGVGEQGYGTTAVNGMWGKVQAEMTDAVAVDQTTTAMTIKGGTGTETSVANFKADVQSGMLLRQAFYKWLAKEKVTETASAALLIQMSVGEFYFNITNPNKYEITIDELLLTFQTTVGTPSQVIDGARQVLNDIYVPAEGEVYLRVLAPTKVYDVLSWLTMAGASDVRASASELWSKIQDGTIVWTYTADMQVSHGDEIQNYTYAG